MIVVIRTNPFFCITSGKDMVVNLQKHVMISKLYCIVCFCFFQVWGSIQCFSLIQGNSSCFFHVLLQKFTETSCTGPRQATYPRRSGGRLVRTVYCLLSPTSTWAHRHLHTGQQGLAAILMQGQERERPLNAVIVKSSPSVTTMKDNGS